MAGAALGFRIYVQLNSQCGRSGNSAPILECDLSSSQGEIYRCGFSDILNLCTRVGHKSLAFGNGFAIGRNGLAGLKWKIYNSCSDWLKKTHLGAPFSDSLGEVPFCVRIVITCDKVGFPSHMAEENNCLQISLMKIGKLLGNYSTQRPTQCHALSLSPAISSHLNGFLGVVTLAFNYPFPAEKGALPFISRRNFFYLGYRASFSSLVKYPTGDYPSKQFPCASNSALRELSHLELTVLVVGQWTFENLFSPGLESTVPLFLRRAAMTWHLQL